MAFSFFPLFASKGPVITLLYMPVSSIGTIIMLNCSHLCTYVMYAAANNVKVK